jgi:hypothetical protein
MSLNSTRASLVERGLPDWAASPKSMAIGVMAVLFVFTRASTYYDDWKAARAPHVVPACYPNGIGGYEPKNSLIGPIEKDRMLFSGRTIMLNQTLRAIDQCSRLDCSPKNLADYRYAVGGYLGNRAMITRIYDQVSGALGLAYIQSIFATPQDVRIVDDLRERLISKQMPATMMNDPVVELLINHRAEELVPCRTGP